MKYYLHDTSAFDDEKVTELFINFGYEGVGLFYVVLEKLAKQEKPVKTEVLKKQLRVGKKLEKCWFFMEQIGIISSNNGETFNKQLLNFSEKYQIKKEKTRKKVSEWREKQEVAETVTSYKDECNQPKVKESKVNKIDVAKSKLKQLVSEYSNQYDKTLIEKFYDYWTEPTKSGTKCKYELERTWDTGRRLARWFENQDKFNKPIQNGTRLLQFEQKIPTI